MNEKKFEGGKREYSTYLKIGKERKPSMRRKGGGARGKSGPSGVREETRLDRRGWVDPERAGGKKKSFPLRW